MARAERAVELADRYAAKLCTPERAVAQIASGSTLLVGMAVGQPPALLDAIAARMRAGDLDTLRLYYKFALEPLAKTLLADDLLPRVDAHTFFLTGRDHEIIRQQTRTGHKLVSFVPCHFSQIPRVVTEVVKPDTFIVTVAPMDRSGHFSLGTNNDFASTAARCAGRLVVEVNRNMPRVFGQSQIHLDEIDAIVEHDAPLLAAEPVQPSAVGRAIGALIAPMVPNGATLQLGVGKVPSAVAAALAQHEDLGVHTELFSPAFVPLIRSGVANGRRKTLHPRKHVFTVAYGDADLYAFMHDNPSMESYASSYVNDVRVIAQNDALISVNTAIEVDLYGQVNAEYIEQHQYSGSGGQFDFVKGASLSKGGKSILALHATAKDGATSCIVPHVQMVTDDRMDVEYVVTEHGVVNLRGRSTRERALALIEIADPKFRDELRDAAKKITLI
jgi:itaconate CoA-transferase